jgi:ABC-2 type transport system permease protein
MSGGWLRPYRAILSARFRMLLQYRAAALAGLWTQIFFGLVLVMIYEAFYRSTTARQPMTFAEVVSYVWLGQALLAMLPWNADPEIRAMVRGGGVAYELCRPVDLYALWYARAVALRTAPTILRAVPMSVFAAVVLPLIGLAEWAPSRPPSIDAVVRLWRSAGVHAPARLRPDDADQHQPPLDRQRRRRSHSPDVAGDVPVRHDHSSSAVS